MKNLIGLGIAAVLGTVIYRAIREPKVVIHPQGDYLPGFIAEDLPVNSGFITGDMGTDFLESELTNPFTSLLDSAPGGGYGGYDTVFTPIIGPEVEASKKLPLPSRISP